MNQFSYWNYASSLELKKYSAINESATVTAADILADMKAGGKKFPDAYKKLIDFVGKAVDKGDLSGDVQVLDTASGVTLYAHWAISGDTVTLTDTKASNSSGATSANIDEAAMKIFFALTKNVFDEDEDAVYAVFRDIIKTDADLNALLDYWKSLKIQYWSGQTSANYGATSGANTTGWERVKSAHASRNPPASAPISLKAWIRNLFNDKEINTLNSVISAYSKYEF